MAVKRILVVFPDDEFPVPVLRSPPAIAEALPEILVVAGDQSVNPRLILPSFAATLADFGHEVANQPDRPEGAGELGGEGG